MEEFVVTASGATSQVAIPPEPTTLELIKGLGPGDVFDIPAGSSNQDYIDLSSAGSGLVGSLSRMILVFDLTNLPVGYQVVSATVQLTYADAIVESPEDVLFRLVGFRGDATAPVWSDDYRFDLVASQAFNGGSLSTGSSGVITVPLSSAGINTLLSGEGLALVWDSEVSSDLSNVPFYNWVLWFNGTESSPTLRPTLTLNLAPNPESGVTRQLTTSLSYNQESLRSVYLSVGSVAQSAWLVFDGDPATKIRVDKSTLPKLITRRFHSVDLYTTEPVGS